MSREARIGLSVLLAMGAAIGGHPAPIRARPGPVFTHQQRPPTPDPTLDRLLRQERFQEALDHAVAELRERCERLGPMVPETLARLELVGLAASTAGEFATGEAMLDATLEAYRGILGSDDPRLAPALITRGRIARLKGQRERAWRLYQEARRLLERAGPAWEGVLADLEHAEGSWLRKDDIKEAVALYRSSLERRRRISPTTSFEQADNLTWLGWMLGRMGRFAEAESHLRQARLDLGSLGLPRHSLNGVIQNAFAEQLALEGRWEEAESFYREVAGIFADARQGYPPGFARRVRPLDGFDALALIALRRGRGEEAWVTLQRSRAAVHQDFGLLGLWRERDEAGFFKARALRRELLALRRHLAAKASGGRPVWSAETSSLVLRSLELRGRLRALQARYLRGFPAPDASLDSVRRVLGPRSAILGVLELGLGMDPLDDSLALRTEGWLYVLRRTGEIAWVPLPRLEGGDVARMRQAWRRTWRAVFWPLPVDPDPEVRADQRSLSRRYFDPALPYLTGIDHLIIEGAIVPYESMVGPDGRMVGDVFDTTYVPSALVASLLAERWAREPERELRSILAFSAEPAGPVIENLERLATFSGGGRDLRRCRKSFTRSETSLDALPSLPYAGAEAARIARKFPEAVVVQGPLGVERRLRELEDGGRLGRFDVVHFAGHSLSDGSPELCALALAEQDATEAPANDGVLDVEEILLGWELDAGLLTLSGCETARAAGAERGEVLGFTAALLASGARSVLSSFWPVDDRATALLMDRFYENVTGRYADLRMEQRGVPMPLARALREAKAYLRQLTDANGRHPFEHPAYWAGFILMGLPEGGAEDRQAGAATVPPRAAGAPSRKIPRASRRDLAASSLPRLDPSPARAP